MSPMSSPAIASRPFVRPSKKARSSDIVGRPLAIPRLLETLDASELRTVLERICDRHPTIGQEVVSGAPRPSVSSALAVLREYQRKLNEAVPYGQSSPDYTYYRVKEPLVALIDALSDFTPQYLPPTETQPTRSLQFLDGATKLIHELPNWEPQAYRHHKDNAYDEISRAWAVVISEASKRGGGCFSLHSGGWDKTLACHNEQSGGRLGSAMSAMASSVNWMEPGSGPSGIATDQSSILNQIISGSYSSPVRVGPW